MAKVEGSNPFIRFSRNCLQGVGFRQAAHTTSVDPTEYEDAVAEIVKAPRQDAQLLPRLAEISEVASKL
jgi:hypothetical protein